MSDDPFGDDSGDDPFEDADPEDDPFEDLADQAVEEDDAEGDTEWASDEESLFSDAVDPSGGEAGVGTHGPDRADDAGVTDDADGVDDDPFSDLGRDASGSAESDPFEGMESPEDDPFEGLEGEGDIDGSVWDDLSVDPESETVSEQRDGRKLSEVSKHRFCEQCPHFTGPPEIRCTYEGSEIMEFLDMETVRVVDCPIVEEREAMGDVQ